MKAVTKTPIPAVFLPILPVVNVILLKASKQLANLSIKKPDGLYVVLMHVKGVWNATLGVGGSRHPMNV